MNSEIKYIMHSISRDTPPYAYPPIRDISSWQRDMIHSLQEWLSQIPQRSGSDCDRMAQLCKIRYHEIMILLLRPSPAIPTPPEDSFDLCFHHAVDLLRGFGELYRSGSLLYSRLVVHSLLLSTFVMLYCIWKVPSTAARCRVDELAADFNTSQNILSSIGEYWTEANRARDCVDELYNVTLQRLLGNDQATALRSSPIANRTRPHLSLMLMSPRPRVKSSVISVEKMPIMDKLIRIFPSSSITPKIRPLLTNISTYSTTFYKAIFKVGVVCRISMALCGSFFIDSRSNVLFYNTNIRITL